MWKYCLLVRDHEHLSPDKNQQAEMQKYPIDDMPIGIDVVLLILVALYI